MKRLILLAAAAGFGLYASAQTQLSLADEMRLARMINDGAKTMSASDVPALPSTSILFRVTDDAAIDALRAKGVKVLQQEGDVVIAEAPLCVISDACGVEGVTTAQLGRKRFMRNDLAVVATHVDQAHAGTDGETSLPNGFDGTGVIVGIVDSGLDPNHISFIDNDGNVRVKRFWDYTNAGREYTETTIPAFRTDDKYETHGTHVAGTAAGCFHGMPGADYSGVATGSDIVMAGIQGYESDFTGALRKILNYSIAQDKPAVVNLSWGSNDDGPHDGTDAFCRAIDNIAANDGIHVFIASGNEGDCNYGVYKELTEDDNVMRTFISNNNYTYSLTNSSTRLEGNLSLWGSTSDEYETYLDLIDLSNPDEPLYSMKLDATKRFVASGNTTPPSVESSANINRNCTEFNNVYSSSYMGGRITKSSLNGCYRAEIAVSLSTTSSKFAKYAVSVRAVGVPGQHIHGYMAMDSYYGIAGMSFSDKGKEGFTDSKGEGTLSDMACGKETITVGAIATRNDDFSIDGYGRLYEEETLGEPVSFSSWGHKLDGSLKPDVLAPGSVIYSAMSTPYVNANRSSLESNGNPIKAQYVDAANNRTQYWTMMGGTSMATPHMTGIAALWLQAKPTLTTDEIRDVLAHSCTKPEDASGAWGSNGLVNAFEGLKYILNSDALKGVSADESAILLESKGGNIFEATAPGCAITAQLVNLSGVAVASAQGSDAVTIDASACEPGVYVLRATTAGTARSQKIVIR